MFMRSKDSRQCLISDLFEMQPFSWNFQFKAANSKEQVVKGVDDFNQGKVINALAVYFGDEFNKQFAKSTLV